MKIVSQYITSLNKNVEFHIGDDAKDNFVIIDYANPEDLWFHVQGFSSCHVIANISKLELDKKQLRQIITQGAVLCKQNSRYAYMNDLAIVYTKVKNIKKTNIVGTVITENTKVRII
jgi:predicted ribosome quality control (RQC) complex YloA/Tae2 family protein